MKFIYEYRTSDNARHQGVIVASDREDAFAQLRAIGIRPGRLADAPGVVNRLFGKGKRWIAIAVLAVIAVLMAVGFYRSESELTNVTTHFSQLNDKTRRQIIGDSAIIEKGINNGWSNVFADDGERFLASFAIPGVPAGKRNTVVSEIETALLRSVAVTDSDTIEVRQIKAMVEGMKGELREYLSDGGTIESYCRRIVQRQDLEIAFYERAKTEIGKLVAAGARTEDVEAQWEKRNAELRAMGVRLVPFPEISVENAKLKNSEERY